MESNPQGNMASCKMREVPRATDAAQCAAVCDGKEGCTSIWEVDEKPSALDRYYYIFDPMSWEEARDFCAANQSRLAVVEDWQDHRELQRMVSGSSTALVERLGDMVKERAPPATQSAIDNIASGVAATLFSETVWIGMRTEPSAAGNFRYVWDGAPEVDNLRTGGQPLPNAYNWGWSAVYGQDQREQGSEPMCGVLKRRMWNRERCEERRPFICERMGRCNVCDTDPTGDAQIVHAGVSVPEEPANGGFRVLGTRHAQIDFSDVLENMQGAFATALGTLAALR